MKNQITITLAQIKKYSPCAPGWSKVLKANGGDDADLNKPFPVSSILDSNGLDDTLWVLGCLPKYNVLWRKFAWWCAVQVKDYTNDDRVSRCLEVVKRYSEGLATDEELSAARSEAAEAAEAAAAAATWAAARSAERIRSNGSTVGSRGSSRRTSKGSAVGSAVSTRNQIT